MDVNVKRTLLFCVSIYEMGPKQTFSDFNNNTYFGLDSKFLWDLTTVWSPENMKIETLVEINPWLLWAGWSGSLLFTYEPEHNKTNNKMTCAPSEDFDQPGHPPSLIRIFAVHSYPMSAQQRLWSNSAHSILLVLSCCGSYPPSLIRVFAVRMMKPWVHKCSYQHTAKTLIRLGGCPGWSESSLGAHHFVGFVVLGLI